MARGIQKLGKPFLLVNAKQDATGESDKAPGGARLVRMPTGDNLNGGMGVHYYLTKRDPASGKPIFYAPEVWQTMNETQRKDARDFRPVENDTTRSTAANLVNSFVSADPLAKQQLVEMVEQQLEAKVRAKIEAEMRSGAPAKERR